MNGEEVHGEADKSDGEESALEDNKTDDKKEDARRISLVPTNQDVEKADQDEIKRLEKSQGMRGIKMQPKATYNECAQRFPRTGIGDKSDAV